MYVVIPTDVDRHRSIDYIIRLNRDEMKARGFEDNDCINIRWRNDRKVEAQLICSDDESWGAQTVCSGQVAVDQSLRAALDERNGIDCLWKEVKLEKVEGKKYGIVEKAFYYLDYQKVIAEVSHVSRNPVYMEHKTPIACLTEKTMTSIGVVHGENIVVEYAKKKIAFKCGTWTDDDSDGVDKPPYLYLDGIGRKMLGVVYQPVPDLVKIRKNFGWQWRRAINRFGSLTSLIAGSVFLTAALQSMTTTTPQNIISSINILQNKIPLYYIYWGLFGAIALWAAWSALTSSKFKVEGP